MYIVNINYCRRLYNDDDLDLYHIHTTSRCLPKTTHAHCTPMLSNMIRTHNYCTQYIRCTLYTVYIHCIYTVYTLYIYCIYTHIIVYKQVVTNNRELIL